MDNFMERITHKFSATEMIKANSEADAAVLDTAKEQIALFENQMTKVDGALSDMRQVNLKNIEVAQELQAMTKDSTAKITQCVGNMENESVSRIKQTSDVSIAGINKTVDESLAKIAQIKESADSIEAIKECVDTISAKLDSLRKDMEEYNHTDHVKIYRNVQAAFVDELGRTATDIKASAKKKGAMIPLLVITMLASLASLAITILHMLGFI